MRRWRNCGCMALCRITRNDFVVQFREVITLLEESCRTKGQGSKKPLPWASEPTAGLATRELPQTPAREVQPWLIVTHFLALKLVDSLHLLHQPCFSHPPNPYTTIYTHRFRFVSVWKVLYILTNVSFIYLLPASQAVRSRLAYLLSPLLRLFCRTPSHINLSLPLDAILSINMPLRITSFLTNWNIAHPSSYSLLPSHRPLHPHVLCP